MDVTTIDSDTYFMLLYSYTGIKAKNDILKSASLCRSLLQQIACITVLSKFLKFPIKSFTQHVKLSDIQSGYWDES